MSILCTMGEKKIADSHQIESIHQTVGPSEIDSKNRFKSPIISS